MAGSGSSSPKERQGSSSPLQQVIEADNHPTATEEDADSTLGHDTGSSTASISSSILQYRTLHGRTYHSERGNASYWFADITSLLTENVRD